MFIGTYQIIPDVKVIVTSGYTASDTASISKPMQLPTLLKEVRKVLDQKLN